jgi:hypothetical protein
VNRRSSRRPSRRPARAPRGRARGRGWVLPAATLALLLLAPAVVHAQEAGTDSLTLHWTATGDDGTVGTAALYDLRMSGSAITAANWESATAVNGLPAPAASGTAQSCVVRGLTPGATYYFALRARDDAGNWSDVSNVVRWDGELDETPPPAPSGLAAGLDGDNVALSWEPSTAPDLAGYSVYRATAQAGPYTRLNADLLTAAEYQDDALPEGATSLWYRVTASDMSGNESAQSGAVAGLETGAAAPLAWHIAPGYPNPSRSEQPVVIPVILEVAGRARVDLVDAGGHLVRRLDLGQLGAGYQEVEWDGRNEAGRVVAPGAYRGWLVAGDVRLSTRLVRVP